MQDHRNILALDIGAKRIGLAIMTGGVHVARPLGTLNRDEEFTKRLAEVIKSKNINKIVVGLPRSIDGNETDQTKQTRKFAKRIKRQFEIPMEFQDEALTSQQAMSAIQASKTEQTKEKVDALAATLILSDYLQDKGL